MATTDMDTPKAIPIREKKPSKKPSMQLKTPKGTRDWTGADIILRDQIFKTVSEIFRRHGGTALDTPVFELKEILAGKYGEDSKLIYDLQDQGGELCALRYDLTVPFARWLAMSSVSQVKRYSIAKVYRRDQPVSQLCLEHIGRFGLADNMQSLARGRLREFFQCDFDFAGSFDPMIPDAETLCIMAEVFNGLGLGQDVTIKINHRKILDGLFTVAGVPPEKVRSISSAVDKLDKSPWTEVKREMEEEKGLPSEVADRIGEWVKHSGDIPTILKLLRSDDDLCANEDVKTGLDEMELLLAYTNAFGITDKISFDLSLARGLDYYTGLIYEAITNLPPDARSKSTDESQVGSIAAGGRYDNLVGMFGRTQIPCVGVSFGVDRIFTILRARQLKEAKGAKKEQREREVDVYVMAFGAKGSTGLLAERMSVARQLWNAGISTEFSAKVKPKLPQQFKAAEVAKIPLAVILGEDELAAEQVKLKVMGLPDEHPEKAGRLVAREELVSEVKKLLQEGVAGSS
jgi:histidyl-tRNA synthetase